MPNKETSGIVENPSTVRECIYNTNEDANIEFGKLLEKVGFFDGCTFTDDSVKQYIVSWCRYFDMTSMLAKYES